MGDPTVFRACYADWQLIRSRSVVKISVEIPIEEEGYAYQVLGGMPDPSKSIWLGIARLENVPTPAATKAVKIEGPKSYAQEAGKMCASAEFQNFIGLKYLIEGEPHSEQQVIEFVRQYCFVDSRKDIIEGTQAANQWSDLMAKFEYWRRGGGTS